jgi:hypothetical protein
MSNKPTNEEYSAFADDCVANLSDSISKRKTCLKCLLASLPKNHPRIYEIAKIYAHLTAHEQSQREFCFTATQNGNHNGGAR